jgi:hypothetical protein
LKSENLEIDEDEKTLEEYMGNEIVKKILSCLGIAKKTNIS